MQNNHLWQLFAVNAAMTPHELAIVANDRQMTYQTLQQEVFYYMDALHQQGVKSGDRVAILLPRDSRLIVALLAVLATGACYIPLDSRNPKQRNQIILDDSQCQYLITHLEEDIARVKRLAPPTQDKLAHTSIQINPDENALAYIIYTSGSTGIPKGVMINHANASSMIHWGLSVFDRSELAYTLAATSICFDLSIFEIFLPLAAGTCIVLVDHALSLLDKKYDVPISLINTVPSAINALNQANAIPDTIQTINLAGEALQQNLVNDLYNNTPVKRIYNLYGPTETTTYSTYYLAEKHDTRVMVPIGKGIIGTDIYLLDQHQQPVPKLVRGEVYIGGKGVSQGYCHRPLETERAFLTLLINNKPTQLYRTGDLARINHAGELEYLGRKDHQIKIRGFRVETDEIVHILKQHTLIREAYVKTHSETDANDQLVAYVVSQNQEKLEEKSLLSWLSNLLPDYMVPQYIIQLESLPTNSNGKIDRAALPSPHKKTEPLDYQNEIEHQLAEIWQSLLANNNFQRQDNFFYVGGHSLLAARLQAKIQETFQVKCKLEEIFEHSSIADQASLISERKSNNVIAGEFTLSHRPQPIPLSFSQQRLWYLHYAQEQPISNIPLVIAIEGELNQDALTQSFRKIIQRHEILRTTYQSIDYQVTQVIQENFNFDIPMLDCLDGKIETLLEKEANKKFDLSQDLMIRALLLKTAPKEFTLMVTQHHIASDAWSLNILMHELSTYYHAYHHQLPLPEMPSPVQYADYSCWQRRHFNDDSLAGDLAFWKKQLENSPEITTFPYDKPKGEIQTFRGEFYSFALDQALILKLKNIANQNQSTLFMVMLTAFNILLQRYSGQNDLCIGILSANRPASALDKTLGFFVNTLTTRNQIDSSLPVSDLLLQVKRNVLDCLANQHVPFDKVVESLCTERQTNRHPFFQVLFSLQNALENNLVLDDLKVEVTEYDRKISKFDLTLSLVEKNEGLSAIFEFNSDLFYRETIERIASHYIQILISISDNCSQPIHQISLLTTNERKRWLIDFNDVNTPFPAMSLATSFKENVEKFPAKIAIIADEKSYSYKEIDDLSTQLANLLISYGIQPGAAIGLLLPRNIENIISLLAVIKMGACYVPIDPAWPIERIDYVLNDANINVVLSLSECLDNLPALTKIHLMLLDMEWPAISQQSLESPLIDVSPTDDCYIMYTSGSTGKPKGVIAQHQGVMRLVKNTNYISLDENQTLLQVSQLVFDGATFDIWGSLLNGGTLVLTPQGLPELNRLAELITTYQVTTLFVTTQLFNTLVDYKLPMLAPIKQLLFGGEMASHHHVECFRAAYPDCTIRNIYGPTECTTYALSYLIENNLDKTIPIPLGTPISNTCAVILSQELQVVPVGVWGEICLGGPGLARGYLNQNELTQEKFIPNPVPELMTDRLYRTGDKGYYRADGQIVFVGRFDDQVKLRGYRIELPEIENALRGLDGVINAVVVVQKPEDLLVAYLIVNPKISILPQTLRQQLSVQLPSYMLPDAIEILDAYPLTANGKIDKMKLPKHEFKHKTNIAPAASLNDGIVTTIHQIWMDILDNRGVTYNDNFFEIGGNSLKIVHVLDRLQDSFKGNKKLLDKLDITCLFQYPTVSSLANYLNETDAIEIMTSHSERKRGDNLRSRRREASHIEETESDQYASR